MLGGASHSVRAYAGRISSASSRRMIWFARPRVSSHRAIALKLRVGDCVETGQRAHSPGQEALGPDHRHSGGRQCGLYKYDDARRIMPVLDDCSIGWLEEPFAPRMITGVYRHRRARPHPAGGGREPLHPFRVSPPDRGWGDPHFAAGSVENGRPHRGAPHPAAMASAWKLPINPHSSATGINMAATIHSYARDENRGYFEADVARKISFGISCAARLRNRQHGIRAPFRTSWHRRGRGRRFHQGPPGD